MIGGSDNPNLENFLGKWAFQTDLSVANDFDVSLLMRQQVVPGGPYWQLDLDYFLATSLYIRLQAMHGYGKSLMDYDRKENPGTAWASRSLPMKWPIPAIGFIDRDSSLITLVISNLLLVSS